MEGGIMKLVSYGLSLPISLSTIHSWMIRLGCKHKPSYYTDGHERPGLVESRKVYNKLKSRLALRQPLWVVFVKTSLTPAEIAAFDNIRETGEYALYADTFELKSGGEVYIECHVDMLKGDGLNKGHDVLREALGPEGGQRSVRFAQAVSGPCEGFHAEGMCKCRLLIYCIWQDDSIYKAYAREVKEWVIVGVSGLRKKAGGPGEMVSAFRTSNVG